MAQTWQFSEPRYIGEITEADLSRMERETQQDRERVRQRTEQALSEWRENPAYQAQFMRVERDRERDRQREQRMREEAERIFNNARPEPEYELSIDPGVREIAEEEDRRFLAAVDAAVTPNIDWTAHTISTTVDHLQDDSAYIGEMVRSAFGLKKKRDIWDERVERMCEGVKKKPKKKKYFGAYLPPLDIS